MGGRNGTGRGMRVGNFLARLLLFATVLRALAPLGFMPDLQALQEGRVEIVLCTGIGFKTITVDAAGRPVLPDGSDAPSDPGEGAGADCAFRSPAAAALLLPEVAALPAPAAAYSERLRPAAAQALPPPAQGPPLGARAPPATLG